MGESLPQIIEHVACTVCSCVCDDLRLHVRGARVERAERACTLAEPWFLAHSGAPAPAAEIRGQPAELGPAVERAGEILTQAQAPLVFGLEHSSTPGQRQAIELADYLGANIDAATSPGHAAAILAVQEVGISSCTLGEVKNRCDLVIYWGCDPVVTHPRHLERYAVEPPGMFIAGRDSRELVVVDHQPTATSQQADWFVQLPRARQLEAIWTLRALIQGRAPAAGSTLGAPLEALTELARRMQNCRSGVVFYGAGLTGAPHARAAVAGLLQLVAELNAHARFYARGLGAPGAAGAEAVLCWQTGYPQSVSFNRKFPRYSPGEYSAVTLLERSEVDACLLLGGKAIEGLTPRARAHLERVPTIVLERAQVPVPMIAEVRFTTAAYGLHRAGTAYRQDDVPIPLRAILPSPHGSDEEVLAQLLAEVRRGK